MRYGLGKGDLKSTGGNTGFSSLLQAVETGCAVQAAHCLLRQVWGSGGVAWLAASPVCNGGQLSRPWGEREGQLGRL